MAQGPMSSILVTIRITIRMNPGSGRSRSPKSEIRIHWILAFGGGLRSLSTSSNIGGSLIISTTEMMIMIMLLMLRC